MMLRPVGDPVDRLAAGHFEPQVLRELRQSRALQRRVGQDLHLAPVDRLQHRQPLVNAHGREAHIGQHQAADEPHDEQDAGEDAQPTVNGYDGLLKSIPQRHTAVAGRRGDEIQVPGGRRTRRLPHYAVAAHDHPMSPRRRLTKPRRSRTVVRLLCIDNRNVPAGGCGASGRPLRGHNPGFPAPTSITIHTIRAPACHIEARQSHVQTVLRMK